LHATIVSGGQELSIGVENGRADRQTALRQTFPRLCQSYREHRRVV
jgi:hypothetical protein